MRETPVREQPGPPLPRRARRPATSTATPSRRTGRGAGAPPTGSWNDLLQGRRRPLRPDGRRRVHPLLPQRRRRPRAWPGSSRRENPATDPVSVRELSRRSAGQQRASAVPSRSSTCGRRPGSSSRTPTGSATAPTTRAATDRIPLAEDDPLRALRHRPPRRPPDRRRTRPRRPEDDGPAADLPQRGHALVGRLAALRQRLGDPAPGALDGRAASCTIADDGILPRRPRDRHRAHRLLAQLVGRARAAAHPLRARAQRDLRPAGASITRPGTTRRCSRRRGWSTPR